MTWAEFVIEVEKVLKAEGVGPSIEIDYIDISSAGPNQIRIDVCHHETIDKKEKWIDLEICN